MASEDPAVVLPLPDLPDSQKGTSSASHRNYTASVSNASGYLCHINLECNFDVPPQVLFDIFVHPDNAGAFRDIKKVGYRKIKSESPGLKVVEVEQCGELRVLWMTRVFRTYLDVTEDARDPECLKTDFELLRSDILSRFHGSWELRPRRDGSGKVVGCHALLEQDVLPKGVPSFFAHMPVLGGLLRRVSLNAIQRLVEDILNIVNKYVAAGGKKSLDQVLEQIAAERGHRTRKEENRPQRLGNGSTSNSDSNVASFAIDSVSESSEGDDEGQEGEKGDVLLAGEEQGQQEGRGMEAALGGPGQAAGSSSRGGSEGGSSSSAGGGPGSSAGGYRVSADGVVTAVLVAPAAAGAVAAGVKGKVAAADEAAAAAAAAVGAAEEHGAERQRHHRKQHQHKHKHRQSEDQQGAAPLVGVLFDVTVHGRVHVDLICNPDAA